MIYDPNSCFAKIKSCSVRFALTLSFIVFSYHCKNNENLENTENINDTPKFENNNFQQFCEYYQNNPKQFYQIFTNYGNTNHENNKQQNEFEFSKHSHINTEINPS